MANAGPEIFPSSRHAFVTPANSTDIGAGDAVMLDANSRLAPLSLTSLGASRFLGFTPDRWSSQIASDKYGTADAYTTPASFAAGVAHKMCVLMDPTVVAVPLENTSGKIGDAVFLKTATSGAQVFTLSQPATVGTVVFVGRLNETFSGATANDRQRVVVQPAMRNASAEGDIAFWLSNHVDEGLVVAFDDTSKVSYTAGGVYVGGRFFRVAAAQNLDVNVAAAHATKARISLVYVNTAGAVAVKDTGGIRFTFTAAGATALAVARNSWFWPTFSIEGVVIGAAVLRSNSANVAAGQVTYIRRSTYDVKVRKYITGGRYAAGSPPLS